MIPHRDPWQIAEEAGRDYLTPEDIGDAIKAGVGKDTLYHCVLQAIARKTVEDWSCCAFVALQVCDRKRKAAPKKRRAAPKRSKTP